MDRLCGDIKEMVSILFVIHLYLIRCINRGCMFISNFHDDVIKWKHFPRYWPFVWGIHRSPVNSPHIGQWRRALIFSLICVWMYGWVNNSGAGDLRRYHAHYDVIVMIHVISVPLFWHTCNGIWKKTPKLKNTWYLQFTIRNLTIWYFHSQYLCGLKRRRISRLLKI